MSDISRRLSICVQEIHIVAMLILARSWTALQTALITQLSVAPLVLGLAMSACGRHKVFIQTGELIRRVNLGTV